MASLKDIKYKVIAIQKTKQITRAMNMVSTAKLRSTQRNAQHFAMYRDEYQSLVDAMLHKNPEYIHPLLEQKNQSNAVGLILVTPDRGLCGAFAGALIQTFHRFVERNKALGKNIYCYCIGRKGYEVVKKTACTLVGYDVGIMSSINFEKAVSVAGTMQELFLKEELDSVSIIHGHFISLLAQEALEEQILPISASDTHMECNDDISYEPSSSELLGGILPRISAITLYDTILDTIVSEHAARMIAMNNATKNCDDLISSFSRLYNKVRQAAVTKELMDIVGGAEALNS